MIINESFVLGISITWNLLISYLIYNELKDQGYITDKKEARK